MWLNQRKMNIRKKTKTRSAKQIRMSMEKNAGSVLTIFAFETVQPNETSSECQVTLKV
jgi:hypothetical protein